jgi:hypothetical protein
VAELDRGAGPCGSEEVSALFLISPAPSGSVPCLRLSRRAAVVVLLAAEVSVCCSGMVCVLWLGRVEVFGDLPRTNWLGGFIWGHILFRPVRGGFRLRAFCFWLRDRAFLFRDQCPFVALVASIN